MAERKSDFTGAIYGDWRVLERAKGTGDGKRRWLVVHDDTGEMRTVLQTELPALAKDDDPWAEVAANPFAISASEMQRLHALASTPSSPFLANGVGPGQCKHDVFVNDCIVCGPLLGDPLPKHYTPQGTNALSAQIARAAIAGMGLDAILYHEAVASVALSHDPDMQTYWVDTREPVPLETVPDVSGDGSFAMEVGPEPMAVRDALGLVMERLAEARDLLDQAYKAAMAAGV